jgi:hypothetical protein
MLYRRSKLQLAILLASPSWSVELQSKVEIRQLVEKELILLQFRQQKSMLCLCIQRLCATRDKSRD